MALRENLAEFLFSIGENSLDIGADEAPVDQEIERHGVPNMIVHERPAVSFLKSMLVNP
jgi:hypothetical protein